MSSEPITLYDQRPLELQLEDRGALSLTYYREEVAPSEPEGAHPEEKGREILDVLKDLAWTGDLEQITEIDLYPKDGVRWEFVCRGKTSPDEQALAVFRFYNRQGEKGLEKLRRRIKPYQRLQQEARGPEPL